MQGLVPTRSGPRKTAGSDVKIAEKVIAGYNRWQHKVHHSLLHIGLHSHRLERLPDDDPCPPPKVSTWCTLASELDHDRRWPGIMNHVFFFTSCGWLVCVWGDGSRMHYWRKANWRRQCDSLGYVLLRNLGSWHSWEKYFVMNHIPKHYCRPGRPLHSLILPNGGGLFQKDNALCHTAKIVQEWFK